MASTPYDATTVRMPLVADLQIEGFTGESISEFASFLENAVVEQNTVGSNERYFVTHRPAFDILEDASVTVSDTKGRGIYYRADTDKVYFVNNDTIYIGSYTNSGGTISAGIEQCHFFDVGNYLVILDPENNEAWTLDQSDTLAEITDADFPSTITHGGAELDGYLFVMDETGVIWQSDFEDPTSWNALNSIEAARDNDGGVYLSKLGNHIFAFGSRSIEIFYNAQNSTGSILNRRYDIYFHIGCAQAQSVANDGVTLKFAGRNRQGSISIYSLQDLTLSKISNNSLDSYLTNAVTYYYYDLIGVNLFARGHSFYCLTVGEQTNVNQLEDKRTIVFDDFTKFWGLWTTNLPEWSVFSAVPVVSSSIGTIQFNQFGYCLLSNGDRATLRSIFRSDDRFADQYYIINQDEYVATDYVEVRTGTTADMTIKIRLGHTDNGINNNTFIYSLEWVGDYTTTSQNLTIKWAESSDAAADLNAGRTLDLSSRRKLLRLGTANRRTWQLEYEGSEVLRGEALEFKIRNGEV